MSEDLREMDLDSLLHPYTNFEDHAEYGSLIFMGENTLTRWRDFGASTLAMAARKLLRQ